LVVLKLISEEAGTIVRLSELPQAEKIHHPFGKEHSRET
jgi:hypothetical protein